VREPGENQSLSPEPLLAGGVDERAAQQRLDCDIPVELVVVRHPDFTHAAGAQRLDEPVSAEEIAGGHR
jgi:hypothetical protein